MKGLFNYFTIAVLAGLLSVGCSERAPAPEEATSKDGIQIISVEPELAEVGAPITISGRGFGNRQDHKVSIGGNGISVELEVVEWQDDKIVAKIPDDSRIEQDLSYYYRVQSNDYKESSNLFQFSFKQGEGGEP